MQEQLNYHSITLEDKERVQKYLDFWHIKAAGLQFATLFLWGSGGRIRIAEKKDALFILVAREKGDMMVGPLTLDPANYACAVQIAEADCRARGQAPLFCVIPEQTAPCFRQLGFCLEEERGNEEYLYAASDLIHLPGKAYHGKRNHINAFLMNESYCYTEIAPSMQEECLRVYDAWMDGKEGEAGLGAERRAVQLALSNMRELELVGGGILVKDRLEAFSIGSMAGDDTAVIHFEKALDKRGLFPLINRDFIAHAFADVKYVNREEDMGDPGLRKAKMSYKPLRLEKIYCACRK